MGPHTQDLTSCLPRGPALILFLFPENNRPCAAMFNEFRSRCLLLRRDAVLVPTTIELRVHRLFLLPIRRNIAESDHLHFRLRVRLYGRMTASVTGSENNSMRLNVLMNKNGAGAE